MVNFDIDHVAITMASPLRRLLGFHDAAKLAEMVGEAGRAREALALVYAGSLVRTLERAGTDVSVSAGVALLGVCDINDRLVLHEDAHVAGMAARNLSSRGVKAVYRQLETGQVLSGSREAYIAANAITSMNMSVVADLVERSALGQQYRTDNPMDGSTDDSSDKPVGYELPFEVQCEIARGLHVGAEAGERVFDILATNSDERVRAWLGASTIGFENRMALMRDESWRVRVAAVFGSASERGEGEPPSSSLLAGQLAEREARLAGSSHADKVLRLVSAASFDSDERVRAICASNISNLMRGQTQSLARKNGAPYGDTFTGEVVDIARTLAFDESPMVRANLAKGLFSGVGLTDKLSGVAVALAADEDAGVRRTVAQAVNHEDLTWFDSHTLARLACDSDEQTRMATLKKLGKFLTRHGLSEDTVNLLASPASAVSLDSGKIPHENARVCALAYDVMAHALNEMSDGAYSAGALNPTLATPHRKAYANAGLAHGVEPVEMESLLANVGAGSEAGARSADELAEVVYRMCLLERGGNKIPRQLAGTGTALTRDLVAVPSSALSIGLAHPHERVASSAAKTMEVSDAMLLVNDVFGYDTEHVKTRPIRDGRRLSMLAACLSSDVDRMSLSMAHMDKKDAAEMIDTVRAIASQANTRMRGVFAAQCPWTLADTAATDKDAFVRRVFVEHCADGSVGLPPVATETGAKAIERIANRERDPRVLAELVLARHRGLSRASDAKKSARIEPGDYVLSAEQCAEVMARYAGQSASGKIRDPYSLVWKALSQREDLACLPQVRERLGKLESETGAAPALPDDARKVLAGYVFDGDVRDTGSFGTSVSEWRLPPESRCLGRAAHACEEIAKSISAEKFDTERDRDRVFVEAGMKLAGRDKSTAFSAYDVLMYEQRDEVNLLRVGRKWSQKSDHEMFDRDWEYDNAFVAKMRDRLRQDTADVVGYLESHPTLGSPARSRSGPARVTVDASKEASLVKVSSDFNAKKLSELFREIDTGEPAADEEKSSSLLDGFRM